MVDDVRVTPDRAPERLAPDGTPALKTALEDLERLLAVARLRHLNAQLATEHGASSETLRPLLDRTATLLERMARQIARHLEPAPTS
jgi:hypothetical protein